MELDLHGTRTQKVTSGSGLSHGNPGTILLSNSVKVAAERHTLLFSYFIGCCSTSDDLSSRPKSHLEVGFLLPFSPSPCRTHQAGKPLAHTGSGLAVFSARLVL